MLKTNYHTHTSRCHHAVGTDEEYIQAAIAAGLTTLGFSDHAAYDIPWRRERMERSDIPDYYASIRSLKEKYRDRINIHLGMEVEYYPDQWETLSEYRMETEYCILGQHALSLNGDSSYYLDTPEQLHAYVDAIGEACRHGLCDYIAHPDVCLWNYPRIDGAVHEIAERIAAISLQYDMPLEINCGSGVLRDPRDYEEGKRIAYPTRAFFETFAEKGCKIIIGLDAHDPKLFGTDEYLNKALGVVEGLHLNIIENYDIIAEAAKRKKHFF